MCGVCLGRSALVHGNGILVRSRFVACYELGLSVIFLNKQLYWILAMLCSLWALRDGSCFQIPFICVKSCVYFCNSFCPLPWKPRNVLRLFLKTNCSSLLAYVYVPVYRDWAPVIHFLKPSVLALCVIINLSKPSGKFTYHQVVFTSRLCILCGSWNKQQLVPYIALRYRFL